MADDELIGFIEKSRSRGRTDEQILQQLISVGWQKERISLAFAAIEQKKTTDKRAVSFLSNVQAKPAADPSAQAQPPVQTASPQPQTAQAPSQQPEPPYSPQPVIQSPSSMASASPQPSVGAQPQTPIDVSEKKSPFAFISNILKKPQSQSQPPQEQGQQAAQPQQMPGAQPSTFYSGSPSQPAAQQEDPLRPIKLIGTVVVALALAYFIYITYIRKG
jgi:hypothetical protein